MTDSNRLTGYFTPHRRFSNKLPRLYLDSDYDATDPCHLKVYFVNNCGQTLDWVELPRPMLYKKSMSEAEQKASMVKYRNVKSNEAVLVAEFDIIFDSDFLHQLVLAWQVPGEAAAEASICGKGLKKFQYNVLEWLPDAS